MYREGIGIGGGVRIMPGQTSTAGGAPSPVAAVPQIDVEGWRPVDGVCRSR